MSWATILFLITLGTWLIPSLYIIPQLANVHRVQGQVSNYSAEGILFTYAWKQQEHQVLIKYPRLSPEQLRLRFPLGTFEYQWVYKRFPTQYLSKGNLALLLSIELSGMLGWLATLIYLGLTRSRLNAETRRELQQSSSNGPPME